MSCTNVHIYHSIVLSHTLSYSFDHKICSHDVLLLICTVQDAKVESAGLIVCGGVSQTSRPIHTSTCMMEKHVKSEKWPSVPFQYITLEIRLYIYISMSLHKTDLFHLFVYTQ